MSTKTTRISKPKKGKVVRLDAAIIRELSQYKSADDSWSDAVLNYIEHCQSVGGSPMWTLPSKLYPKLSEANGVSVKEAAQSGTPITLRELPIKVYEGK